VLSGASDCQ